MKSRYSLFTRTFVTLLNGVLVIQPFFASMASAQVITDTTAPEALQAEVTTNQNGVPMVNIAAPNSNGLSHNQYQSYSVDNNNLILNNSNQTVDTIVGGQVNANPNLTNGTASIILNEVTGIDRSSLEGYTEIAGDQAELIIANPNGITCNGCGFINTPRAVLSTGTPQIRNQQLMSLSVNQGDIRIEGEGVNTGNVDQFDLITRSVRVNGEVLANNLNIITGQNSVDYNSLEVTPEANPGGNNSAPQVAIDSSLLGGMYANTIRLVGTEAGVGVNLDGEMATNTGEISLSADGTITVNTVVAAEALTINSAGGGITVENLAYGDSAELNAQQAIDNQGTIAAVNSISQSAASINNQGDVIAGLNTNSTLNTGANITLDADAVVNSGQLIATEDIDVASADIDNTGGLLDAIAGNVTLNQVTEIDNTSGSIQAGNNIELSIDEFDTGLEQNLQAEQNLIINTHHFTNTGGFSSDSTVVLNLTGDFNNLSEFSTTQGYVISAESILNSDDARLITNGDGSLTATVGGINNRGVITAADDLTLISSDNILNQNVIGSGNNLSLSAVNDIENHNGISGSLLFSVGDMDLFSNRLINRYSDIYAFGDLQIAANENGDANALTLNSSSLLEAGGSIAVNTQLFQNRRDPVTSFDNSGLCVGSSDTALCNGTIHGGESVGVAADTLLSQAWLFAEALEIRGGGLSDEDEYIAGQGVLNQLYLAALRTPTVYAGNNIDITAGGFLNQAGLISAANNLTVNANDIVNETLVTATLGPGGYAGPTIVNTGNYFNADGTAVPTRFASILNAYLGGGIKIGPVSASAIVLNVGAGTSVYSSTLPIIVYPSGAISIPGEHRDGPRILLVSESGQLQIQERDDGFTRLVDINLSQIDEFIGLDADGNYQLTLGENTYPVELGVNGRLTAQFDQDNLPVEFAVTQALANYTSTAESAITYNPYDLPYISQVVDTTFFPAQLEAGNSINLNASNTINNGVSQIGSVSPSTPPEVTLPEVSVSNSVPPSAVISSGVVDTGNAAVFDELANAIPPASDFTQVVVDTDVPSGDGGLFTETDSDQFLVATNASVSQFVNSFGTDYLLEQLNYQPETEIKRLGDGFYESYLIRRAVMAQTGRRFVHRSLRSDQQQFRYFMDNAIAAQSALDLTVGVRLTPAQVASLTHDMVWLEEQIINGQRILVPTLYLASVRNDDVLPTGMIMARNINLEGGSFNSTGSIIASNHLGLHVLNDVINRNRLQSAGSLSLSSEGHIRNESEIVAADNLSVRAGRNLTGVNARFESGGDMYLESGNDTTLSSTTVNAGGNASLSVGNNLTLNSERDQQGNTPTPQTQREAQAITNDPRVVIRPPAPTVQSFGVVRRNGSLESNTDSRVATRRAPYVASANSQPSQADSLPNTSGSQLQVGGNLSVDVGNDMHLSGSHIHAEGDAYLQVEGSFTSRQGRTSRTIPSQRPPHRNAENIGNNTNVYSRRAPYGAQNNVASSASSVLVRGNLASLVAGGNLTLITGRGISAGGTNFIAENGNTNLVAESGDIRLNGGVIRSTNETNIIADEGSIHSSNNQILASEGGIAQIASEQINNTNSRIATSGNVEQQAGGDIIQTGGSINARGNITQFAEGAIENRQGISGSHFDAGGNVTQVAGDHLQNENTRITSGGGVVQQAGGDLTLRDARISAEENITQLAGGNIDVRRESAESTLDAGGDVTAIAQGDLTLEATELNAGGDVNLAGENVELSVVTTRNSSSTRSGSRRNRVVTRSETVRNQGTEINAGGNVAINAEQNLTITSGVINAEENIALNAGGNTLITAVQDEDYSYYRKTKKKRWGRKTTRTTETLRTTNIESELNAGGNVTINSRINPDGSISSGNSGEVVIQGSTIDAGQQVAVSGDGVSVLSQTELDYQRREKTRRGFGGLSSSSSGRITREQILQNSRLTALSEDLSLLSGGNITIMGSDVISGGDINLVAVDDILLSAQLVLNENREWSRESRINPLSTSTVYERNDALNGETTNTARASTLNAQGDVNLDASRITVVGSDVTAGEGINATSDVGDIRVLSAQQVLDSYSQNTEAHATVEDVVEQQIDEVEHMLDVDSRIREIGTDDEQTQATTTLTQVQYDQVDTRTQTIDNRASQLIANGNVNLDAAGDIEIQGSDIVGDANADQSGDINLQAGGDVSIRESGNVSDTQTDETHGQGELSAVVQHQAVEIAQAAKAVEDAKDKVKDAKEDYREYQKQLRNLRRERDRLAADYADEVPGISYEDIVELDGIIDDAESDEEWYQAGVVLAAANLASKVTLLVQQTVAGAASVGTWGFNAGIQLDLDATRTESDNRQESSRGSTLAANNIHIATGAESERDGTRTQIQASHLSADNLIQVTTGDLEIEASRDNSSNRTDTESAHIRIAQTLYGAAGGPTISVDYERSRSRDGSTHFNNSTLHADNIELNSSNDTVIRGANVDARDTLELNVGNDLLVQSQQNRYNASNNSLGLSAGISMGTDHNSGQVNSVNGGVNTSNGRTRVRETVLTTVTGETVDINVGNNTAIVGATIAATDAEGNDNGQLSLDTQSLEFVDLNNTAHSSQQSAGISTNINLNGSGQSSSAQTQMAQSVGGGLSSSSSGQDPGTTRLSYSNNSSDSRANTLATVGEGDITVRDDAESGEDSTERLNRDIDNTERDIYDVDQPAIDLELEVENQVIVDAANVVKQATEYIANNIAVSIKKAQLAMEAQATIDAVSSLSSNDASTRQDSMEYIISQTMTDDGSEGFERLRQSMLDKAAESPEAAQQLMAAYLATMQPELPAGVQAFGSATSRKAVGDLLILLGLASPTSQDSSAQTEEQLFATGSYDFSEPSTFETPPSVDVSTLTRAQIENSLQLNQAYTLENGQVVVRTENGIWPTYEGNPFLQDYEMLDDEALAGQITSGYGAGSQPDAINNTYGDQLPDVMPDNAGGNQIADQQPTNTAGEILEQDVSDGTYVNPGEELQSPTAYYSESAEDDPENLPNQGAADYLANPTTEFLERISDVDRCDCDDLAKEIFQAAGSKGRILDLTVPNGEIIIREFGELDSFIDHRIYTDGNFVFDPRFSDNPVPLNQYLNEVRKLNPGLIVKDVTP